MRRGLFLFGLLVFVSLLRPSSARATDICPGQLAQFAPINCNELWLPNQGLEAELDRRASQSNAIVCFNPGISPNGQVTRTYYSCRQDLSGGVCPNGWNELIAGQCTPGSEITQLTVAGAGQFMCSCQIGQGSVVCSAGPTLAGTGSGICSGYGIPDRTVCPASTGTLSPPSGCNGRLPCNFNASCIDPADQTTLLRHNASCDPSNDRCDSTQGLSCNPTIRKCTFPIGSRGGPTNTGSSCVYDFECISQIGIDDSPLNDYSCMQSVDTSVECDTTAGSIETCRCVAPEGTCIGGECGPIEEIVSTDFDFCRQVPEGSQRDACIDCLGQSSDVSGRIYTAVGCLRTSQTGLAGDLIRLGLGIGGGLALLAILAASFIYSTSQGDPSKLKNAKELATGAVSGLIFMIFSVIMLNFVGVQILRIPGLAGGGEASSVGGGNGGGGGGGGEGGGGGGEDSPPPESNQTWETNDVGWVIRQSSSDPAYLEVCLRQPAEGGESNTVSVQMRPVLGDITYDFVDFPTRTPPNPAGDGQNLVGCGLVDMADYTANLARNLVAQQTSVDVSQRINYRALISSTGDFNVRSSISMNLRDGASLDPADVRTIFETIPTQFRDRFYVELVIMLNGESAHQYRVQIGFPAG